MYVSRYEGKAANSRRLKNGLIEPWTSYKKWENESDGLVWMKSMYCMMSRMSESVL